MREKEFWNMYSAACSSLSFARSSGLLQGISLQRFSQAQDVVLQILLQGYLPPGRRQDKRHKDVRVSERSLEQGMQWRGRVKQYKVTGREQGSLLQT